MEIKKLETEDLKQAYDLLNVLYENTIKYDVFVSKFNQLHADKNFYCVVAKEENKVFGIITARIINRIVKTKNILFIDDLIVDEKYRSKGIGQLLLDKAINFAKESDCETIELTSYISNEKSHKFYEKNSFVKQHYKFKHKLD